MRSQDHEDVKRRCGELLVRGRVRLGLCTGAYTVCSAHAVHMQCACPMRFIARNMQEHSPTMTRPMTPKIAAIVRRAIVSTAADHCMHTPCTCTCHAHAMHIPWWSPCPYLGAGRGEYLVRVRVRVSSSRESTSVWIGLGLGLGLRSAGGRAPCPY